MQRLCLAMLRFCLSAWVGIAVFFVMLLMGLRQSEMFTAEEMDRHPQVFFPIYYGCEFALLLPAFACACAGLWNLGLGRGRRIAMLQLAVIALALAVWDFGLVYQKLAEMMVAGRPYPSDFHLLHRMSRWLNVAIVCACAAGAVLALIPEKTRGDTPP